MLKKKHCPHILVLTSTFPRWKDDPEPAFVYELNRRLINNFDITVLAPRSTGSKNNETMAGLRIVRFPYFFRCWENFASHQGGILSRLRVNPLNYLLVPFFLIGQLLKMLNLLRNEHFDLIHAHWIIPQGLVAAIALTLTKRKIPLVCTSHGGDLFALRGRFFYWLKNWIINRSKGLTVVSSAMKETVENMGIKPNKVRVISMGVDLKNLFVPDPQIIRNSRQLLFVGRLVEKKGLNILLKAISIVLTRYPDIRLIVAGTGPLESNLRQYCHKLNILDNVDFMGMVPQLQLPYLYQKSTMAIFPFIVDRNGDQEGLGLVVVEAMGCKCPVIASELPAIKDTIYHKKTGLFVPSGDIEQLAETIIKFIENPDILFEITANARHLVLNKFDWDVIADQYIRYLTWAWMHQ